jgi:hypothetical protein
MNTDDKANTNRCFTDSVAVSPRLFKPYYRKQSERCTDSMEHVRHDRYHAGLMCTATSLMISQQLSSYRAFSDDLAEEMRALFP